MLPFLKQKPMGTGIIIETRKPDVEPQEDGNSALEAAARDILDSFKRDDAKMLAKALQAAYDICDSSEQVEPSNEQEEQE